MQDRAQKPVSIQMTSHSRGEVQVQVTDQKDLAALWAVGVLFSILLSLAGLSWSPARYEAKVSNSVDPMEAQIENGQNRTVADAINDGRIEYHPTMEKLVKERPFVQLVFIDLVRILLFPTAPLLIISLLIRKTIRESKKKSL